MNVRTNAVKDPRKRHRSEATFRNEERKYLVEMQRIMEREMPSSD
jgi:hypothetical protein